MSDATNGPKPFAVAPSLTTPGARKLAATAMLEQAALLLTDGGDTARGLALVEAAKEIRLADAWLRGSDAPTQGGSDVPRREPKSKQKPAPAWAPKPGYNPLSERD